jgi:hypothetical protein
MSLEMTEELFKEINDGTEYFVEWFPDGTWVMGKKPDGVV